MNRPFTTIALLAGLSLSGAAQATLHDRGGGLIYDDVLNVTWLQDANYAKTSGYDDDGLMTWQGATGWVTNLSYFDSVRHVIYDDWRLPTVTPVNGIGFQLYEASDDRLWSGSRDWGYNISAPGSAYPGTTASEMAYMYYVIRARPYRYGSIKNGVELCVASGGARSWRFTNYTGPRTAQFLKQCIVAWMPLSLLHDLDEGEDVKVLVDDTGDR